MTPYSEYKESRVPWLGKIPSHWKLLPCRAIVDNQVEKNDTGKIEEYLSLMANIGVVRYEEKGDVGNKKPEDLTKCKLVKQGNLVINSMNYAIGSYGMSPFNGVCSPVYIVLEPKEQIVERRYALRLFENKPMQKHLAQLGNGILQHRAAIKWDDIKPQAVPVPPLEEQRAILYFLDRETQRIDSLIEEKQAFIKLLKEKRQALISHVVTKGLNPDVEMQDSGIEWIGQVPKHWEKCRVKQVSSFITSGPRGWSDFISDNGNAIFLQSGDLNNELGLNLAKAKKVSPPDGAEGQRTQLQLDDVVVCITGANTGRVALVKELDSTVYINQHLSLIRPIGEKVRPKYLAYFLSSEAGSRYYALEQYGLKEGLSLKNIAETPLMLPPVSEQTSIEKYLDKALAILSSLVTSVEESINLLKEHRTSLISAAVTGKIDVREAV